MHIATFVCRVILSSVVCLYHIFPNDFIKAAISLKKVIEPKMCALISSTNFVENISHSEKNSAEILSQMYAGLHVKWPLFFSDFKEN
jgi:hypothetical protein